MIHVNGVNARLSVEGRNSMQAYNLVAAVVAMAAVTACGGTDIGERSQDPTVNPASGSPTTSVPTGKRTAVASLQLEHGKTIEFFSYAQGTLVLERGEISTAPVLSRARDVKNLVDIWKTFSAVPAPAVLAELDQQIASGASVRRDRPSAPEIRQNRSPLAATQVSGAPAGADITCGNGCCDYAWLSTFAECQEVGNGGWFHYNYGWSRKDSDDVNVYGGFVCAATGTTIYWVEAWEEGPGWGGESDYYTLNERDYINYFWRGTWEYEFQTVVNFEHLQALHTYCGYFFDT
jgi:hypothetical protein